MPDDHSRRDTPASGYSPEWPNPATVRHALDLIESGNAFIQPDRRGKVTVIPTAEYKAALHALWPIPTLKVHCGYNGCDQRLGRWSLQPSSGVAEVSDVPQRPADRGTAPTPWTARLAAGKGGVEQVTKAHDGKGTVAYPCSRCHHRSEVGYRRRTTLFLQALHDQQSRIYLN